LKGKMIEMDWRKIWNCIKCWCW